MKQVVALVGYWLAKCEDTLRVRSNSLCCSLFIGNRWFDTWPLALRSEFHMEMAFNEESSCSLVNADLLLLSQPVIERNKQPWTHACTCAHNATCTPNYAEMWMCTNVDVVVQCASYAKMWQWLYIVAPAGMLVAGFTRLWCVPNFCHYTCDTLHYFLFCDLDLLSYF